MRASMSEQHEPWVAEAYKESLRQRSLPVPTRILSGESLSSWIVRTADAHGMSTQQLGAWLMGRGRQIFCEDVDRGSWNALLEALWRATGQASDIMMQGTLRVFEGVLWGEMPRQGVARWVLPIIKYGTLRSGYGVQYCAECLATDEIPYHRLVWRLAFNVTCPTHQILLRDRCNRCHLLSPLPCVCHGRPQCIQALQIACGSKGQSFRLSGLNTKTSST